MEGWGGGPWRRSSVGMEQETGAVSASGQQPSCFVAHPQQSRLPSTSFYIDSFGIPPERASHP